MLLVIRYFAFIAIIGIVIGGVAALIFGSFQSASEPEESVNEASDETDQETEQEQKNTEPESYPDPEVSPGQMSGQEAASIVLERLGGGSIKKMKLKEKDGRRIYKV